MNRSLYFLLAGGISLLLGVSCKKEPLLKYIASDNIYFDYIAGADSAFNDPGLYIDSLDVTFSFSAESVQDTLVGIPIAVTGSPKDYDRAFSLTVDPASTAIPTENYELPASFRVPAGKLKDSIFIRFKRTPSLKTTPVLLALRLNENDQFMTQLKFKDKRPQDPTTIERDTIWLTTFTITVADMLAAGPYWTDYRAYFGTFSEKKVRLINQLTGMPLSLWSVPVTTAKQRGDLTYYAGFTARYLRDQEFAGNPIFESDGVTPMKMGERF